MVQANRLLREYYKGSLIANRDCVNGLNSEPPEPYVPEYNFEVVYARPKVVTISEGGSVFCGGAHPNNYVPIFSFDLVNGQQIGGRYQLDLSPQGFGTILKLANKNERIAFENFAHGHWQEAAKAGGETDEDGCGGANFMGEQQAGKRNSACCSIPKAWVFSAQITRAAANCLLQDYNPTIIPWADIKPYLRNEQILLTTELK